jgi:hypothetical protein
MGIIHLYKENPRTYEREILGTITESQLEFLIDNLEEELEEEEAYLLNADSISFLKEQNADKSLIALLEKALADAKGCIDIFYAVE